jgi:hypothetical protein
MQSSPTMRAVLILLAMVGTARADGFEWDPPPPSWELRLSTIFQGRPGPPPYAGLTLGFEHRLEGRVWAGFVVALMGARETSLAMEPLPPLHTAAFGAATARVQLGEHEQDGVRFAWEARAELGTAFVVYERMRSTPAIGSAGLTGSIGGRRTRGLLSLGAAFALGGESGIDPGGVDVRMGVARVW